MISSRRLQCICLTGRQRTDIGIEIIDAADAVRADILEAGAAQHSIATTSQRETLFPSAHIHSPGVGSSLSFEALGVASRRHSDGPSGGQESDYEDGVGDCVCAVGAALEEVACRVVCGLHGGVGGVAGSEFQGGAVPVDELVGLDVIAHGC